MIKIKFDLDSVWSRIDIKDATLYAAGTIFYDEKIIDHEVLMAQLNLLSSVKDIHSFSQRIKGQFSFIFENDKGTLVFIDKIRSYPVLKYKVNDTLILSNSVTDFESVKSSFNVNDLALLSFEMSGYTLGNDTLYEGLQSIGPGTFLYYNKKDVSFHDEQYYSFFSKSNNLSDTTELLNKLDQVVNQSVSRLIQIADGRKIILPLSAGLDSRLILGKLVELGYSNILTYTYGSKNIWEKEVAEKSAKQLGVEWIFLNLTNSKKEYHTVERKEYFKKMCYYISVPHIADYYSLNILQSEYAVDLKNSVIVNGQSGDFISGAHIPKGLDKLSKDELLKYTIDKHFSLWTDLKTPNNTEQIKNTILNSYSFNKFYDNKEFRYKLYENLECDERQIKYVINGQRAYDWYKMDWYLPLWSDEMLDFWRAISQDLKTEQYLYKEYCKKFNPSRIFDIQLSKNTHSIAWYLFPFLVLIKFLSIIDKRNSYSSLKKRYLSYFEKYMPFYPHLSYFHYLKEAKHHRNPVSFWVRSYLQENNFNQ